MPRNCVNLTSKDEVQNIKGTGVCKTSSSWRQFWINMGGGNWPRECRIFGCTKRATDGAHVRIGGIDDDIFIIPMCKTCNTPNNTQWMRVNTNTTAVQIEEEDTDGPANLCVKQRKT